MEDQLNRLVEEVRQCRICEAHLPLGPRPVVDIALSNRIAIISQAPGTVVHGNGIPWKDKSGDRLRSWMNVDEDYFYNSGTFAIIPMGFCYPGKGKGGDLPPRKECAPQWHTPILRMLPNIELVLVIGAYSQAYYLGKRRKKNLTETVRNFSEYLPDFFPLVHPSPRNGIWLRKNPWYEEEVVPQLKVKIKEIISR